jgi:DNA repair exonuclease SbcCD ATPase subunit
LITFKKLRYKNILSTGNAFTEIDFTRNKTTLVIGENGAGKSTMLDALSFVLYGKPFRKINKPQLLNSVNQKGLLIEIDFTVGKKEYLIRRGIKPNVFEIHQNGNMINQTASIRDYQDFLEKNVLKMNHKSFSQVVVLGSSTFVPFMQLTAAQRREVIEDLLDLQIFSTMNNLLKEKIQTSKNDVREIQYQIDLIEEKIEIESKHLKSFVSDVQETIRQKNTRLLEYKTKIDEENILLTKFTNEIKTLERGIRDKNKTENKQEEIRSVAQRLQDKVKKINKDIEFFEHYDNCPTCKQDISKHFKDEMLTEKRDSLFKTENGISDLKKTSDELQKRLNDIIEVTLKISELNEQISKHNGQIHLNNQFVSELNKEIVNLTEKMNEVRGDKSVVDQLRKDQKGYQKRKTELNEEQSLYRVGSEMLKDSGIKSRIIKQYIPVMNKLINHYLQLLGFFVQFELDENFNEKIKSRFRDEFSYESFSEGEKMRIDLSLLFTWRTIAKLRNSVSTNLLIMDEVFDSSLDGNGTEEFLKILEGLTADTNTFIISHKGDMMIDKFRSIIRFEKHQNFSRIAA